MSDDFCFIDDGGCCICRIGIPCAGHPTECCTCCFGSDVKRWGQVGELSPRMETYYRKRHATMFAAPIEAGR